MKSKSNKLIKLIAFFTLHLFMLTSIALAAPQEHLAPTINVQQATLQKALKQAMHNTPGKGTSDPFRITINPPKPLYLLPGQSMEAGFPVQGLTALNNRPRTYKEDLIISIIASRNARGKAFLTATDQGKFVFVDLHIADHLLAMFPPDHTNQSSVDRLIQEIIDYTLLLEIFLARLTRMCPPILSIEIAESLILIGSASSKFLLYLANCSGSLELSIKVRIYHFTNFLAPFIKGIGIRIRAFLQALNSKWGTGPITIDE